MYHWSNGIMVLVHHIYGRHARPIVSYTFGRWKRLYKVGSILLYRKQEYETSVCDCVKHCPSDSSHIDLVWIELENGTGRLPVPSFFNVKGRVCVIRAGYNAPPPPTWQRCT